MKTYLFTYDSVVYFEDGELCRKSWQDFSVEAGREDEPVRVLVTTVRFDVPDDTPDSGAADGRVIMQESGHGSPVRIISAPASRIQDVFALFPQGRVVWCVPYALAVREYLARNRRINAGITIVLEEALQMVFLTVMDGLTVLETREFPAMPVDQLLEELRRSAKLFSGDSDCRVISANARILERAQEIGWSGETVAAALIGIEGSEYLRVTTGFLPPGEQLRRTTLTRRFGDWLMYGAAVLLCGGSLVWSSMAHGKTRAIEQENLRTTEEIFKLKNDLRKTLAETYEERMRRLAEVDIEEIFYQFVWNIPFGWNVESFEWLGNRFGGGTFMGEVFVNGGGYFGRAGIFQDRKVLPIVTAGQPAVQVKVEISKVR